MCELYDKSKTRSLARKAKEIAKADSVTVPHKVHTFHAALPECHVNLGCMLCNRAKH